MSGGVARALVADQEVLARFVMRASWVRQDGTVKQDAFMPPRSLELSVSRHVGRTEANLWARGAAVAAASERPLVGRADIGTGAVRAVVPLVAVEAPLAEDPGHAHIVGWPPMAQKPAQKALAARLAAAARFVQVM
ncbi:MAG: hypothetical protein KJZ54_03060 [Phycisphaerales bacterium]|nr:hypothetical protein [Phycisphaerales bacterium]